MQRTLAHLTAIAVFASPLLRLERVEGSPAVYDSGPVEISATEKPGKGDAASPVERLDELVSLRLREEFDVPALRICTDAVFLRRAHLCAIGTLPTEEEARLFLDDPSSGKREALVDSLLEREEFTDYWTMKWEDLLRVKSEFPINLWPNAVEAYHRRIRTSVRKNQPYHEFVRNLLTANGSNFRVGEVNFYRAMQDRSPHGIAATVAQTLMGERVEHWPKKKHDALAAFFSQVAFKPTGEWKEEIVYFDPAADVAGRGKNLVFPDGTPAKIQPGRDPREVFADWLLRPDNPAFTANICNRAWAWIMGRGIVHEPDDFRPDNPPSNPELLDFLQAEFVKSRCDIKALFGIILKSQTFQASPFPVEDTPEAAANFAHFAPRRMEAEVLIDAIDQIAGTRDTYSSPIPEPFTFTPEDARAITLADGSITSSFLELFGRPPRDTGRLSERSLEITAAQRLHMLNSTHIHEKIRACPLVRDVADGEATGPEHVEKIYLTVLSRRPTDEETAKIDAYAETSSLQGKEFAADLVWALLNQPEFYLVH
ncbi:MAG: DUF1553 domain-containing protein [Verrucomicrobiales bacterium]